MSNRKSRSGTEEQPDSREDEGFLERWSRRKAESGRADLEYEPTEDHAPAAPESIEEVAPLTDEDLPDLDKLDQDSDYSLFLAAGISPDLRRKALRQLFHSKKFNVIDGLDDYCEDLTTFEPLGDIVTADMKARAEALIEKELAGDTPADAPDQPAESQETTQPPQRVAAADDADHGGDHASAADGESVRGEKHESDDA
jgi:hypothetical protein